MLLVVLSSVVLFSCNEKKEEQIPVEPTIETAPEPVATPESKEENGTSIKVSSDGFEYSDDKTKVEVSKDGGEVKKN